ncbi:S-phase kinase-associated protein 1-like [Aedes albopictus]|uniref:S-phase kinase-associated protein 1 n=1 Tax=Aedes albopictus TaxID=7160 RepID=A0ABM1Z6G8_AEDAL
MPYIKVETSDGEIIDVDAVIAKCSSTIKTIMDNLSLEGNLWEVIPLSNVDSNILRKILLWVNYHKDNPTEEDCDGELNDRRTDNICHWDRKFMEVDQQTLFKLMQAVHYLNIRGLVVLTCKTVANMMKGKTQDQVRGMFNITNDLTKEQQDQFRRQHEWYQEYKSDSD